MSNATIFPAPSGPMVDSRGVPTQPWVMFFLALWNRTGAASGLNINDLANDLAQAPVSIFTTSSSDEGEQAPPTQQIFYSADDVLPVIGALRDEIAMLRGLVDDLQKGPSL